MLKKYVDWTYKSQICIICMLSLLNWAFKLFIFFFSLKMVWVRTGIKGGLRCWNNDKVHFHRPLLARKMQDISRYLLKTIYNVVFWTVSTVLLPSFSLAGQEYSEDTCRVLLTSKRKLLPSFSLAGQEYSEGVLRSRFSLAMQAWRCWQALLFIIIFLINEIKGN